MKTLIKLIRKVVPAFGKKLASYTDVELLTSGWDRELGCKEVPHGVAKYLVGREEIVYFFECKDRTVLLFRLLDTNEKEIALNAIFADATQKFTAEKELADKKMGEIRKKRTEKEEKEKERYKQHLLARAL